MIYRIQYNMGLVSEGCNDLLPIVFVPDDVMNMTRPMHGTASEAVTQE